MNLGKKKAFSIENVDINNDKVKMLEIIRQDGTKVYVNLNNIVRMEILGELRFRLISDATKVDVTITNEQDNNIQNIKLLLDKILGTTYEDAWMTFRDKVEESYFKLSSINAIQGKDNITVHSSSGVSSLKRSETVKSEMKEILDRSCIVYSIEVFSLLLHTRE